jgi:hypothetical protein
MRGNFIMYSAYSITIKPRIIVVDISAQCTDAAMLDAAGGAIYGAYHYDAAAPYCHADGTECYTVYPLAVTPLRESAGFSADKALAGKNPKTGLPLKAAYLQLISERFGPPQAFPDVVIADRSQYADSYAEILNCCLASGFDKFPSWVTKARKHKTLKVRQKPQPAGRLAPESYLVDYITADGSRGCFGIDMRNHVDKSLPRPACSAGWSTPAEILQAVEKQFSRCADIAREQYEAFEVPVHGRVLREAFFWSPDAAHDDVLRIHSAAPDSGQFTISYLNRAGRECEVDLKVVVRGAAFRSGMLDWLDIVVAIEQECANYPGFDLERYSVAEVSDGVRTQREMFLPQPPIALRQAA